MQHLSSLRAQASRKRAPVSRRAAQMPHAGVLAERCARSMQATFRLETSARQTGENVRSHAARRTQCIKHGSLSVHIRMQSPMIAITQAGNYAERLRRRQHGTSQDRPTLPPIPPHGHLRFTMGPYFLASSPLPALRFAREEMKACRKACKPTKPCGTACTARVELIRPTRERPCSAGQGRRTLSWRNSR